ncbi:MAG: hypothetical protein ABUL62_04750 [Myxococcales bacterium]
MAQGFSRMLTATAIGLAASVLSIVACTHTTDRVVEPAGAGDASAPTPELSDAGLSPLTPIALPPEPQPAEDYRMVRAPELGLSRDLRTVRFEGAAEPVLSGGAGGTNNGGMAGSDRRPVAAGGNYY